MVQVFAAAILASSKAVEAANRLIEFLASPRAAETIARSGMAPLATAR
jgi:ABC-type Fe3+ transport system substrate-binding protein